MPLKLHRAPWECLLSVMGVPLNRRGSLWALEMRWGVKWKCHECVMGASEDSWECLGCVMGGTLRVSWGCLGIVSWGDMGIPGRCHGIVMGMILVCLWEPWRCQGGAFENLGLKDWG